eukprot:CAMPEP_0170955084 /NCGR_PEP_ID=MMETSP0735-20130129/32936_1 /TAXON_ID=186038 /ORGANISM="Fragilariopsis kerguelensis, Strain L26-C5" /LENGTH=148 /DNA_ID=CAMNT_0011366823 /DNA_START=221 /DNA_END=664 /DNA_ORIENTATION=-
MVILAAQAYIASFHMGGVFYHVRLGHHPLTGCAPGVFVVFAFIITAIRTGSMLLPLVGLLVCTLIAYLLSRILVNPTTTPRLTTTPTIDINDDDSDRHDEIFYNSCRRKIQTKTSCALYYIQYTYHEVNNAIDNEMNNEMVNYEKDIP